MILENLSNKELLDWIADCKQEYNRRGMEQIYGPDWYKRTGGRLRLTLEGFYVKDGHTIQDTDKIAEVYINPYDLDFILEKDIDYTEIVKRLADNMVNNVKVPVQLKLNKMDKYETKETFERIKYELGKSLYPNNKLIEFIDDLEKKLC